MKKLLGKDDYYNTIYNKYKNEHGYINENNINEFAKNAMNYIPQDYIKETKSFNYPTLLSSLQDKGLFSPEFKKYREKFDILVVKY